MNETCSICGAPMENGRCTYCGATNQNTTQQSYQDTKYNQGQSYYQEHSFNQGQPYYTNGPVVGQPVISPKNRSIALLLCVFLGPIGVHHFYAGKVGMGILYLLTGGLCGIGVLVNLLQILCGSYRDQFGFVIKQW